MTNEGRSNLKSTAEQELVQLRAVVQQQANRLHFVEQALQTINSPVTIADMLQPDFPLVYVNEAFEQLTGYSAAEIMGRNCRFLQNDDRNQPGIADMQRALAERRQITVVIRNYRKDGSMFWNEVSLAPIHSQNGQVTHFIGIQHDVTERKAAEESLHTTKGQLQAILDNSVAAIFVKDLSGCYIVANRRFQEITGTFDGSSVEGKYDHDLYPPERAQAFRAADARVLSENREVETEDSFLREGEAVTYLTVKFPLRDSAGQPYAIGGIATDITDRKRSETELQAALARQQELNDLKVRFVSMASHEFRTPLTAIMATAESLAAYRSKMNDDEIERRLSKIQQQVTHLRGIIDDVLQLTRVQVDPMTFKPEVLDLDTLCRDKIEEFQNQPTINHHMVYQSNAQPCLALVDVRLMNQILNNLISNAVKYSSPHTTIWVDLFREDDTVMLTVRDEGIGIPPDDLRYLFEAFHRASNVGAVPGTGLGLAIAAQAAARHGGAIDVESTVGAGTAFTVKIPQNRERER